MIVDENGPLWAQAFWTHEDYQKVYEDRIIAFIDILGFSEMIIKSTENDLALRTILASVDVLYNEKNLSQIGLDILREGNQEIPQGVYPSLHTFSDCVVISVVYHPVSFIELLHCVYRLAITLLAAGVFTRGSIVSGKLFDNERVVFGPGLIDAYNMESRVAKYPRILVDEKVRALSEFFRDEDTGELPINLRFRQDIDEKYHLDILKCVPFYLDAIPSCGPFEQASFGFIRHMDQFLAAKLKESKNDPSKLEKVKWFNSYYRKWKPKKPKIIFVGSKKSGGDGDALYISIPEK